MTMTDQEIKDVVARNYDTLQKRIAGYKEPITELLNCCDIKLAQTSKSVNIDVHMYEHATRERIDNVIDNAIYAFLRTQEQVKKEILKEE